MKIRKLSKEGILKVHIEDTDYYEVTADNGVDIWFTPEMLERLGRYGEKVVKV